MGAREPLDGTQVTLQGGAANPQAIQVLLNTATSQGIVVKPEPGASTSQIIQALSDAAIARGFPLTTSYHSLTRDVECVIMDFLF